MPQWAPCGGAGASAQNGGPSDGPVNLEKDPRYHLCLGRLGLGAATDRFTVQEAGKAGQKCKVLKTWKTPDGKIAYQVQALNTGEMMTIVETGPSRDMVGTQVGNGSHAQAVATRIFHWGLERMPPPGTPVPPVEEFHTMPPSMSDSQPKKLASTEQPNTGKSIAPTYSEPAKSSTFFPWFSRSTPPQPAPMPANLPQPSVLNSTPAPQSTTALPNTTTAATPSSTSPHVADMRTMTTTPPSQPSSTANKLTETLTPRPTTFSPYPATPTTASPALSSSTTAPPRVVQVMPPKNDTASPAPTSAVPAPAVPKSPLVNQQATPVTPVPSAVVSSTNEKKPQPASTTFSGQSVTTLPAANATQSPTAPVKPAPVASTTAAPTPAAPAYKPFAGYSAATPYSSVTPITTSPSVPTGSSATGPAMVASPQANSPFGNVATPVKRIEDTKPTALTPAALIPKPVTTITTPAAVTAAPPSDWRQSWGKADDGKPLSTDKPVQSVGDSKPAATKPLLPQADSKRPDPLQMPAQYDRRPVEEKPSAQKGDTMLVPAVAATSSNVVKPVAAAVAEPIKASPPVATVAQSIKAPPPVATVAQSIKTPPAVTMPVPLGAQSVIQAGDPGPGGVRYIPVPMVTIPDVRRPPVPPMTTPAQAYGASGTISAGSEAAQANAFTPVVPRQTYAQATNAFSTGVAIVPAAPTGLPVPASSGNSMLVQATHPAASTNLTNPGVSAAAYQTAMNPAQPPTVSPAGIRPLPDHVQQMVAALRDSLYPSQREWAAESMATVDWRAYPQVVQVLTTAAKEDPAATVRAECVRCLAKMKANTAPVVTLVRELKKDADPRVRQEAEQALTILAAGAK